MPASKPQPAAKPQPATRQEVLAEFRRSEILAAAVAVFAGKGYTDARMDDIAAGAGLAKGTLYLYFRSKEEVYEAAVRQALDQLASLTAAAVAEATDLRSRIEAFISVRVRFWEEKTDLYKIILSLGRDENRQSRRHDWLREAIPPLSSILAREIAGRRIPRANPDALAWAILDLIRGATERRLFTGDPLSRADVNFLVNFILAGLHAPTTSR